jgi:hypothetical protein
MSNFTGNFVFLSHFSPSSIVTKVISTMHGRGKGKDAARRAARRKFNGSYIVEVEGKHVVTSKDVQACLDAIASAPDPPQSIRVLLAPERRSGSPQASPLHLRMADVRRICALLDVDPTDVGPTRYSKAVTDYMKSELVPRESLIVLDDWLPDGLKDFPIHRLETSGMTDEEKALKSFTRRALKNLDNWKEWDEAFDTQLDQHHEAGTFLEPIPRPTVSPSGGIPQILRIVWSNLVKSDGRRKCRACLDGSKRSAPQLRNYGRTYASCIEQPCQRLFFAIAASQNKIVTFADTTNAFQQSPPPTEQCYLQIDDAYASWYLKRFSKNIDRTTHVIPLGRALQGHPEAGALWEKMANTILKDPTLGFTATTHERNLYRGIVRGETVYICRQVDDFSIASDTRETANYIVSVVSSHATTTSQGIGDTTKDGAHCRYNGVDIWQMRDFVKISCETYIDCLLQTHNWSAPATNESDRHDCIPLSSDNATNLQQLHRPMEGTPEHKSLEVAAGFAYRQVLGELIYAYVVCRVDIGFAVTFLARYAAAPALEHYQALKTTCKYLCSTKSWGLHYWRPSHRNDLPYVEPPDVPYDATLPHFPRSDLCRLVATSDAAYAVDLKTRKSVTGLSVNYAGGCVAYKSKLQATVATSSTEAEFIAAVSAAKIIKYLRYVLQDLDLLQDEPTLLYIDNQATMHMVNDDKPTPRSRHINIQYFAIQEWREAGILKVEHIPGVINPSDAATKALASQLHRRHVRRLMGHHGRPDR